MPKALVKLVKPPAVGELAYNAIRDMLIEGGMAAGERLVEAAISVRLGISRTPVREALARLSNDGFLIQAGNGYRVPIVSAQDIENMCQVRALLEPEAARQAAANPGITGLAAMRRAMEDADHAHRLGDANAVVVANRTYRVAWATRTLNPMLLEALTKAMSSLQLIRRKTMADPVLRDYILEMQRGLLTRIEARDERGAETWQLEHVLGLQALFRQRLFPEQGAGN